MKRTVLVVVTILAFGPRSAPAGSLAYASVQGSLYDRSGSQNNSGTSAFASIADSETKAFRDDTNTASYSVSASASLDPTSSQLLLKAGSTVFQAIAPVPVQTNQDPVAYATAGWQDTLHVTGAAALPSSVRLVFSVDGTLHFDPGAYSGVTIEVFGRVGGSITNAGLVQFTNTVGNVGPIDGFLSAQLTPATTPSTDYSFVGQFALDVPLTGNLPGNWGIELQTIIENVGSGNSVSDFTHTLTLTDILLPDGNSPGAEGFTVTFDSGLRPQGVPEPSTFAMLACSALGLVGYARLRKNAKR